jgi:hypothetical protein
LNQEELCCAKIVAKKFLQQLEAISEELIFDLKSTFGQNRYIAHKNKHS